MRMFSWLPFVVLSLVSVACDTDTVAGPTAVATFPGLVIAEVRLDPPSGPPGTHVTVTVRATAPSSLQVFRADTPSSVMGEPVASGEVWTSVAEIVASDRLGLQVLGVQGTSSVGTVLGYASFVSTTATACPAGSVRAAGVCTPVTPGHVLEPTAHARISLGHPSGASPEDGVRLMLHPRQIVRVDDATVGCHSDHIGIVWLGDYTQASSFEVDGQIPADILARQGISARTETVFTDVVPDLSYCENFAWVPSLAIGITGHRGTGGDRGGLLTWKVDVGQPQCSECDERFAKPQLLHSVLDERGFEGLVVSGTRLFAARKPSELAIYDIGADGTLTSVSETTIPGLQSAWNIAVDGSWVYLTDPSAYGDGVVNVTDGPNATNHVGHIHPGGGRIFVVDASDPAAPKAVGWGAAAGATKSLAILPEDVVAVANGASGVQLFDVTNHTKPVSIWTEDTPGTASDISFSNGWLLVADWDSIRLYDASERGVLLFTDASDAALFGRLMNGPAGSPEADRFSPPIAMAFARMEPDGTFFANDLDRIFFGQLAPGAAGSRVVVHEARKNIRTGPGNATAKVSVRLSNGSREVAWARVVETDQVRSASGPVVIAPGESGTLEADLQGLDGTVIPKAVTLQTSDLTAPDRVVALDAIAGQYQVGDLAPAIAMPGINWCDEEAEEGCDLAARCVSTADEKFRNKPILLAIFSSW